VSSDEGPDEGPQPPVTTSADPTVSPALTGPDGPLANAVANAIDADEQALEDRMIALDLAGDATMAKAYARRLDRLRQAKAGGSVTDLAAERAKRQLR
jgi:hypothetical protein